ncbi:MAG: hypothetical protein ACR2JU_05215, partial [Nocardioidaceae bacterium]
VLSATAPLFNPMGVGDAFWGVFLPVPTEPSDPVEAAVRGTVSASFVCQTRGAFAAARSINRPTALRRAHVARHGIRKVS